MAEEIDESGFYREDFSTESDWEVFNAQLCEIFQGWDLSNSDWGRPLGKNELFQCKWKIQSETLELQNKEMTVSYYVADLPEQSLEDEMASLDITKSQVHVDLMSLQNTFGGTPMTASKTGDLHTLARLYGLRRFVVMHPTKPSNFLTNPSEFCFFQSAINVVAAEVCSTVPIFVQIYDPKWNFFVGVHVAPSMRINFNLVALEVAPPTCKYLSGLLPLFNEKLPMTYKSPAVVSVSQTKYVDTIKIRIPLHLPFSKLTPASRWEDPLTSIPFNALPYGYFPDSSTEVYKVYTWPAVTENMVIDSELRTEFEPFNGHLKVNESICQVVHANAYLSSCLLDFQKLADAKETLEYYVGRNFSGTSSGADELNPLDQLTQPKLTSLRPRSLYEVRSRSSLKRLHGPMHEKELSEMLLYLFPNMQQQESQYPYAKQNAKDEFDPLRIKSAPIDSLVCRLSCLLATTNAHYGSKNGVAQLWATFTRDLRACVDNCIRIPGVAPGFPDTRTCLLHQKLQMLNVCMQRREVFETGGASPTQFADPDNDDNDDDDDDDEEVFFDCTTTENVEETTTKSAAAAAEADSDDDGSSNYSLSSFRGINEPEGRLKRLGDLKLLDSGKPLYVPITQDPVPKTEDQLHDDAEVMLKLGPGSGLTTQMMCSSLLSDMEAFKAANPQSSMEDFIRWYSPKDWEETTDDEGKPSGQLSARMLAPGNTWQTVWQQAKPVPVSRQKRLFDDTHEALKVLHYLETRNIGEIYELTLIPMLHSAALKLKDIINKFHAMPLFKPQLDEILSDICRLSRDIEIIGQNDLGAISGSPNPAPVLEKIMSLEMDFYQYNCFKRLVFGEDDDEDLEALQQRFRQVQQNGNNSSAILSRHPSDGGDSATGLGAGSSVFAGGEWGFGGEGGGSGVLQMKQFFSEHFEQLVSKEYVIRVDGETTSASKGQGGPQFLRAIITGEKLRLCGAFSESTTFV